MSPGLQVPAQTLSSQTLSLPVWAEEHWGSPRSVGSHGNVQSGLGWLAWAASWVYGQKLLLASSQTGFGGFPVCGKRRGINSVPHEMNAFFHIDQFYEFLK